MGLFSEFRQSLQESAGRILWGQLQDTVKKLANLEDGVRANALGGFLNKRKRLVPSVSNMSANGRIETGIRLQKEAKQTFDLNVSEGYALWLTGAWLESMDRPGADAAKTHDYLNSLAEAMEQ